MPNLEIITTAEFDQYAEFYHSQPHGLYQQSPSWAKLLSESRRETAYFLMAKNLNGEWVGALPVFLFEGELGNILTSVPQAGPLGGILCSESILAEERKAVYESLIQAAKILAKKMNCLSLSIISNPFLSDEEIYLQCDPPNYILKNFCQVMDPASLIDPEGNIDTKSSSYNNDIRRNLKKAQKNNVVVSWGNQEDFPAWYETHEKRHMDLNATPLNRDFLENAWKRLSSEGKGGLAIARVNNEITGGCLFFWNKDIADVFIMSSRTANLNLGVNYAITHFGVTELARLGVKKINWQSCKRDSGVFNFKQRWGSVEMPYSFLTWIFDDFPKLFEVDPKDVMLSYPWHYVAPFAALNSKALNGIYQK